MLHISYLIYFKGLPHLDVPILGLQNAITDFVHNQTMAIALFEVHEVILNLMTDKPSEKQKKINSSVAVSWLAKQ